MKTNVNMIRKMGNFIIIQRTKDGMFNATKLLTEWNKIQGNPQRDLSKFWEQDGVKSFIEIMMEEENLHTPLEAYVKSKASRGDNSGTWMHPILFIKFAMWINPRFEYFVIRFVYDQLIEFRHNAGDNYKCLTSAAEKLQNVDYSRLAKGLNYIIFGKHEPGLRQKANAVQLKRLTDLEEKLAFAIDMGYINSFDQLINEMFKLYKQKNLL